MLSYYTPLHKLTEPKLKSGISDVTVIYNPEISYTNDFIIFNIKYTTPTVDDYKYTRVTYILTMGSIEIENKSIISLKKGHVEMTFDISRCYMPAGNYTFTINVLNNLGKDVTRVINFIVK